MQQSRQEKLRRQREGDGCVGLIHLLPARAPRGVAWLSACKATDKLIAKSLAKNLSPWQRKGDDFLRRYGGDRNAGMEVTPGNGGLAERSEPPRGEADTRAGAERGTA
jgi:hypothetical protein